MRSRKPSGTGLDTFAPKSDFKDDFLIVDHDSPSSYWKVKRPVSVAVALRAFESANTESRSMAAAVIIAYSNVPVPVQARLVIPDASIHKPGYGTR